VPHRAQLAVAAVVVALVAVGDLRDAIGFSSFTVLVYYAITNASALTLRREPGGARPAPQALAAAGLAGCLLLALALPVGSVLAGAGVLAAGAVAWFALRRGR
jgi:APA family basic amino acid/polyamine antiporter